MVILQKNPFVPSTLVPVGYEAVYTGEVSGTTLPPEGWPVSRFTDAEGRVILQWSV